MKKGILIIPLAGAVATVVALGVNSIKPWKWSNTGDKKQINYCLLIGQTDHNDSAARTRGIREALHTRPENHDINPNVEKAKKGSLTFKFDDKPNETYEVNELESKVCISDSGATWDQSTAINTCNTWYAKFQNKITMVVSNNDGMAEGALFSSLRPDGMPIFGYDSNESTMKLIQKNKITGTINSNAPAQVAAINIIVARILKDSGNHGITSKKEGDVTKWDYSGVYNDLFRGFKIKQNSAKGADNDYIEKDKYITDILGNDVEFKYDEEAHSILVSSNEVTKDNVNDFLKSPQEQAQLIKLTNKDTSGLSVFQSCYSQTDTYMASTMNPLMTEIRKKFNMADSDLKEMVYGNGNDEDKLLNAIETKPLAPAYIINMTKTVNADKYIAKIKTAAEKAQKDWKKIPIIFYNRQPTDKHNVVDPTWMKPETNGGKDADGNPLEGNPYVFYVGFDANTGADKQGNMIREWLIKQVGAKDIVNE